MRRTWNALLALLFGTAVALVLGEVVLRVSGVWIGRHTDTMFSVIEHDERLGWKMPPNVSRRVDFVDVEGIAVRSNSDGFWDAEFRADKPEAVCRVAFLGDSFTWGMGVEEHERFSNLVDSVDALNFGVPGFGTDQALLTWTHEAQRFAPDAVLLTVYENDYYDNVHDVRYGRAKPYFELRTTSHSGSGAEAFSEGAAGGIAPAARGRLPELALMNVPVTRATFWDHGVYNRIASPYTSLFGATVQTRSRFLHWLVKNSDLVRLAYRASQASLVSRRLERQLEKQREAAAPPPAAARERSQRELELRLILALRDRASASGSSLIVAFAGKTHPGVLADMAALREAGIPVIDATTDAILPHLPSNTPIYFPYNQHWTPSAHQVVAGLITEEIRPVCGSSAAPTDAHAAARTDRDRNERPARNQPDTPEP